MYEKLGLDGEDFYEVHSNLIFSSGQHKNSSIKIKLQAVIGNSLFNIWSG